MANRALSKTERRMVEGEGTVRLLICGDSRVAAVTDELKKFLISQGYQVVVAHSALTAVELARSHKPTLAFIPATSATGGTLDLMEKLSLLGVPFVLINGHGAHYVAASDTALARALSKFARKPSQNGHGQHE